MNLPQNCTVYLMTTPAQVNEAAATSLPLAHMAYRVGNGPHLFRTQTRTLPRGGVMVVSFQGIDGRGTPEGFCREVMQECAARGFSGVFFDFEGQLPPVMRKALESLAVLLKKRNCPLYLPENSSICPENAVTVISTALSGGSLSRRLREAVERYGEGKVALGLEWSAEDFTLPAADGQGTTLPPPKLHQLLTERSPSIYFSDELCAHYFTYMRPGESAHFVLYDDAASMANKLRIGANLGISAAFLPFPEDKTQLQKLLT